MSLDHKPVVIDGVEFHFGWDPDDPAFDAMDPQMPMLVAAPTEAPTRNREVYDPSDRLAYEKHQNGSNFCVDFSGTLVAEYVESRKSGKRAPPYSPLFSRWNSRDAVNRTKNVGTQIRYFADAAKTVGICSVHQMPTLHGYLNRLAEPPTEDAFIEASNHQIAASYRVGDFDVPGLFAAIQQGYVVHVGIPIYQNHFRTKADGVVPFPDGGITNYHAIALWDIDWVNGEKGVWSPGTWGTSWGKNGWIFLRERLLRDARDNWVHTDVELV